jgi:PLP dependent protein
MMQPGSASIAVAVARLRERVAAACARAARDASGVQIVAVSKTVPVERIRAALAEGIGSLGENRVQEAEAKVAQLPDAAWHLVGHLQGNKAGRAMSVFEVIESVDSVVLAERLDRLVADGRWSQHSGTTQRLPVYLQVNVDADPTKAGFSGAALEQALPQLARLSNLDLCGLMTVGRQVDRPEDARSTFCGLAELAARLREEVPSLGRGLSMGMSDDFEIAIEEGATLIRVGRAIFGDRPHDHVV